MDQVLSLKERIAKFMPARKRGNVINHIHQAVNEDASRFDEALALLEDMHQAAHVDEKSNLSVAIYDLAVGEFYIQDLTTDMLAGKLKTFARIYTPHYPSHLNLFVGTVLKCISDEKVREILTAVSEPKVAQDLVMIERIFTSFKNNTEFPVSAELQTEYAKKLVSWIDQPPSDIQKAAYDIVINHDDFDVQINVLRGLFENGTRHGYKTAKKLMEAVSSKRSRSFDDVSHTTRYFVKNIDSPAAYRAYVSLAIAHPELMDYAIELFEDHDNKEISEKYGSILKARKHQVFANAERTQMTKPYHEQKACLDIAKSYLTVDAARAMSMMARIPDPHLLQYHEYPIHVLLVKYGKEYNEVDHSINLLIARGNLDSLKAAAVIIAKEDASDYSEEVAVVRQEQKMLLIEALGQIPTLGKNSSVQDEPEKDHIRLLRFFAQAEGICNTNITQAALGELAVRKTELACRAIHDILTEDNDGWDGITDIERRPYKPQNEYASFAMNALIGVEEPNMAIFKEVRGIANHFGDDLPQRAFDYFVQNGSKDAVAQIRHLKHVDGKIAYLKTLPTEQAISEIAKTFNDNAYSAINGLLDLRKHQLKTGAHDVDACDQVIRTAADRLAGKDNELLKRIRLQEGDQLKSIFGRLKDEGVVDYSSRFREAVRAVICVDAGLEALKKLSETQPSEPKVA